MTGSLPDSQEIEAFHRCIENGDVQSARNMLSYSKYKKYGVYHDCHYDRALFDSTSQVNGSVLAKAVKSGNSKLVELILENGGNIQSLLNMRNGGLYQDEERSFALILRICDAGLDVNGSYHRDFIVNYLSQSGRGYWKSWAKRSAASLLAMMKSLIFDHALDVSMFRQNDLYFMLYEHHGDTVSFIMDRQAFISGEKCTSPVMINSVEFLSPFYETTLLQTASNVRNAKAIQCMLETVLASNPDWPQTIVLYAEALRCLNNACNLLNFNLPSPRLFACLLWFIFIRIPYFAWKKLNKDAQAITIKSTAAQYALERVENLTKDDLLQASLYAITKFILYLIAIATPIIRYSQVAADEKWIYFVVMLYLFYGMRFMLLFHQDFREPSDNPFFKLRYPQFDMIFSFVLILTLPFWRYLYHDKLGDMIRGVFDSIVNFEYFPSNDIFTECEDFYWDT